MRKCLPYLSTAAMVACMVLMVIFPPVSSAQTATFPAGVSFPVVFQSNCLRATEFVAEMAGKVIATVPVSACVPGQDMQLVMPGQPQGDYSFDIYARGPGGDSTRSTATFSTTTAPPDGISCSGALLVESNPSGGTRGRCQ